MVVKLAMAVVVAEGTVEREKKKQNKKKERKKVAETGKRLIFWLILDPIFSSLRP